MQEKEEEEEMSLHHPHGTSQFYLVIYVFSYLFIFTNR